MQAQLDHVMKCFRKRKGVNEGGALGQQQCLNTVVTALSPKTSFGVVTFSLGTGLNHPWDKLD